MMKQSNFKKMLTGITCIVLIAAMALVTCGCTKAPSKDGSAATVETPQQPGLENGKTYGQGATAFPLTVTHADGTSISVTIATDKTVVGEALQALGILAGEEGPYGLYIKTVDRETLDYNTHGMYWSFYVNDAYAMTGVDQTTIEPGVSYALKAEKG